jgi:flagellar hook-basal body complex protein FliE
MKDLEFKNIISSPTDRALDPTGRKKEAGQDPLSDFKTVLSASVKEVDRHLHQADQSIQEMSLGKIDIHNAMIDIEKADISFRMLMQVRNRAIAAYEEIMRMQF